MKRIVAYTRVSTNFESQENSLENQKLYFENYVKNKDNWELMNIYSDEGITATSTKKRKEFTQMIRDAENGKFDVILTKEVSRFSRNILDTIDFTRKLKAMGIEVHFLLDRHFNRG